MWNIQPCSNAYFILGYNSLSHLTTAEINGGLDGLLLGMFADSLVKNSEWKLSQIIDAYYSLQGTTVYGNNAFAKQKNFAVII